MTEANYVKVNRVRKYIAGPMRGYPECNFPAFHAAAELLRGYGYHVFSPAELDVIFPTDEELIDPFVFRDLHVIQHELRPGCEDGLVLLPGWENSVGAMAEHGVACWRKLKITTLAEEVRTHGANSHSTTSKATEYKCPIA